MDKSHREAELEKILKVCIKRKNKLEKKHCIWIHTVGYDDWICCFSESYIYLEEHDYQYRRESDWRYYNNYKDGEWKRCKRDSDFYIKVTN